MSPPGTEIGTLLAEPRRPIEDGLLRRLEELHEEAAEKILGNEERRSRSKHVAITSKGQSHSDLLRTTRYTININQHQSATTNNNTNKNNDW